jgi:hypothetical protein
VPGTGSARGEGAIATLKTWKILAELRCCPRRATAIVQAILTLHQVEPTATQDEKRIESHESFGPGVRLAGQPTSNRNTTSGGWS